ncbi:hypothetical protein ISS40_06470 [Candidatus Bathyarchaeota archaeon]|nr:hypothetical protein [Candidatus Bathyarchaeota archaeon]MBL7168301.1 hypothetical protein [Candidatus Bathyarchaeota archaeon]
MSDRINLDEIERRAYLSYHEDGLVDMVVGIGLFVAGLYAYAEMIWLMGGMVAVITPMYISMKKKYTFPRIGQVTFSTGRTRRSQNSMYFLVLVNVIGVLLGLAFWMGFSGDTRPQWMLLMVDNFPIVIGVAGAVIWAVLGYITELKRFYRYAAATLVVIGSANFIPTPFIAHMLILSGIVMVSGFLQFQSFKRKYPIFQEN